MGKIIKTALVVGAIFAISIILLQPELIPLVIGSAGFVGESLAAIGIGLTSFQAAFVAGAVIGGALGALSLILAPDIPSSNNEVGNGSRLNKNLNPEENRKIIFGETSGASDIRYWEVFGEDDKLFDEVIAVATHKVESFGEFHIEDELIPFSGVNATGRLAGFFQRHTVVEGSGSVGPVAGAGALWNPQGAQNTKMTGIAYYVLKWVFDREIFPRGFSNRITQVVKGALLYDPRLDTSRGGSGDHRTDNQLTWEYNDGATDIGRNPVLQILWYLLGWEINGKLVAGMGVDPDDIDFDSFISAANDAETQGYLCDVVLSTGDSHKQNLDIIRATMGGVVLDTGGRFSAHVAIDDTGVVAAAFVEDDFVGPIEFVPKGAMKDQFNAVEGRFVDPDTLYQLRSYPKITSTAFVSSDGFERSVSADFIGVQDNDRSEVLARLILDRSRFQNVLRAPVSYKGLLVKNWDIVTITMADLNMSAKKFRVIDQSITINGVVILTLREEDASIYTGVSAIGQGPPTVGDAGDPSAKIPLVGLALTAIGIQSDGVGVIDAIQVDWTAPSQRVKRTQIHFKRTADAAWRVTPSAEDGDNQVTISPLEPNTSYDVRARHISTNGVFGDFSSTVSVTTDRNTVINLDGVPDKDTINEARTYLVSDATDGSRVEIPDNNAWDLAASEAMTVEMWIRRDTLTLQAILSKNNAGGAVKGWGIQINNDLILITTNNGTTVKTDNGITLMDVVGRWYHLAVTRSNTGVFKAYVNGIDQLISITENADLSNVDPLQFFVRENNLDEFAGAMRDVQFWSIERTQQQIIDNKHKILTGSESGLLGLWRMDEGDKLNIFNLGSVGSTGDGILIGGITWGGAVGQSIPTFGAQSGSGASGNLFKDDGSSKVTEPMFLNLQQEWAEVQDAGGFRPDDNADVTASNTAAAIAGQGALAVLDNAAWGSDIADIPTELTDGRIPDGLNSSGDLNRDILSSRADSSNMLRRTSGGLFTGELAADRTGAHPFETLADNLVLDHDMELTGTDHWIGAASITKSTTQKKFGAQSLRITHQVAANSDAFNAKVGGGAQLNIPVEPGETIFVSGWVFGGGAVGDTNVGVREFNAAGSHVRFSELADNASTGVWEFIFASHVIPSGTFFVAMWFQAAPDAGVGFSYWDRVTLRKSEVGATDNSIKLAAGVLQNQGDDTFRSLLFGGAQLFVQDGDSPFYEDDWQNPPLILVGRGGLTTKSTLSGDVNPQIDIQNPTTSGFDVSARIVELAGTPTLRTETTAGESGQDFSKTKLIAGIAWDDTYTIQYDVTVGSATGPPGEPEPTSVIVEFYYKDGAAGWVFIGSRVHSNSDQSVKVLTNRTATFNVSGVAQNDDFGISKGTEIGNPSTLDAMDNFSYSTATAPADAPATLDTTSKISVTIMGPDAGGLLL